MMMFLVGYALGMATLVVLAVAAEEKKKNKAMHEELKKQKLERYHREVYAPGFEFIELKKEKFR